MQKKTYYDSKSDFDKNHHHGLMYSFTKADSSGKKQRSPKRKKEGEEENKEETIKKWFNRFRWTKSCNI